MTTPRSTQHLLAAAVAACALAVTACSGAAPERETDVIDPVVRADPTTPTADATSGPVTTIPDGFPLDAALGEPPVADDETTIEGPAPDAHGVDPETVCGGGLSVPNWGGRPLRAHDLHYSVSGIEYRDGRTIRAFPTEAAAAGSMATLRDQLAACDRDRLEDSDTDRVWQTFPAGDDTVTFGWAYDIAAPAGVLSTVTRVGNAVLAVSWYAEYSSESLAQGVDRQQELVGLITPAMCVFSDTGCGTGATTALPDDLPLGTGLYDMSGDGGDLVTAYHPDRTPHWLSLELCGRALWPVAHTDELLAYATGPEYADTRDLLTLRSADDATEVVAAIRTALGDCHGEDDSVWTTQHADTGYDSVTFTLSYRRGLGLSTYQVTRVGGTVLFSVAYGEGSLASAKDTVEERTDITQQIAAHL